MNQKINILNYICCPDCKSDFSKRGDTLVCQGCKNKYKINDGIPNIIPNLTPDIELSIEKWDEIYKKQLKAKSYHKDYDGFEKTYAEDTLRQLGASKKIEDCIYLEIGCGPFFVGQDIASRCKLIIGIDFCPSALKIARKMLDDKKIKNYILIQGDILNMPIKDKTVDLIYGGGVIEHFKDTNKSVKELYRILKPKGVSFNTVPYFGIGSLTYRQIWGNIPNVILLKQIAELIHIRLLKGKHMIFGYELSFTKTDLTNIHKRAGFKKVQVDKFEVNLAFAFLPKSTRGIFTWLAKNYQPFWPMVKVIATR